MENVLFLSTESDVNYGTDLDEPTMRDPLGVEDQETDQARASSSSSPGLAVTGSSPAPVTEDSRAHQLLRKVVQNLGLQIKEVSDNADPMVDMLASAGPSRVVLPLIKTICVTTKLLWQTPASLPPTAKRVERKYFGP